MECIESRYFICSSRCIHFIQNFIKKYSSFSLGDIIAKSKTIIATFWNTHWSQLLVSTRARWICSSAYLLLFISSFRCFCSNRCIWLWIMNFSNNSNYSTNWLDKPDVSSRVRPFTTCARASMNRSSSLIVNYLSFEFKFKIS